MSILRPEQRVEEEPAKRIANQLKRQASTTFSQLIQTYETGLSQFWQSPRATPQEISDELGNQAAEFFRVHGALATFIMTLDPDATLTDVATLGTFTMNQDGTVTATRI